MSASRITTSFSFIAAGLLVGACVVKQPMGVGGDIKGEDQQVQNQQPPPGETVPAEQGDPPPAQPASTTAQPTHGVATAGAVVDCSQEFGQDVSPDLASAKALPDGSVVQGCFTPGDKADAYTLTAAKNAGGVLYRFRLQTTKHLYMCLRLYNADRERVSERCVNADDSLDMWILVDGGSSFYVKADTSGSDARRNRPYTLEVSQRLVRDDDEPNDTVAQATPLSLGKPHSAYALALTNRKEAVKDVYKVKIKKPGKLKLVVANAPEETQLGATLTNSDGEQFRRERAKNPGATLRTEWDVTAPGEYYITVSWAYDSHNRVGNHGDPPTFTERPYEVTATLE